MFPLTRARRLRRTAAIREMVRETKLDPGDFVYPLFVRKGKGIKNSDQADLWYQGSYAETSEKN